MTFISILTEYRQLFVFSKAAFIMYGRGGGGAGEIFKCQKIFATPHSQLSKKTVIPPPPSNKKKTAIPPPPPRREMEVEVNDRKSDKKHEWEKYLFPFPKTERMVYYNKVVKDIP